MCSKLLVFTLSVSALAGTMADQKVVPWVQGKVRKLEPKQADRRFDQIGWVSTVTEALKLSKQSGRPIFIFTHDGDISTGRC
jgi:hypothetical protein